MGLRLLGLLVSAVLMARPLAWADDDAIARTKKELLPRPVTLKAAAMPLSEALGQLSRQTGNQVVDRRHVKTDLKLKLDLENSTFWPGLDAIAKTAGCGISTYQADGRLALVDAPVHSVSTVYQGIFRVMAKRISVARDDEAARHICTVTLDVAWEPRFEPLYLEVGPMQAVFAADSQGVERQAKVAGQGKIGIAGRNALEVEIRLPAPMRSSAKIKSLEGRLQLTGPAKMLTFAFPHMKAFKKGETPIEQRQEGVRVNLVQVKTASRLWSVEVHIENPPGNPPFESYQSWLNNNRIWLQQGKGAELKTWLPEIGDERVDRETAVNAEILYNFRIPPGQSKGALADWTLLYRTPGQIVDIEVPFALKDVPLP